MTPAIEVLERLGHEYALHEYLHDTGSDSYGIEAAEKLGVESARILKTLILSAGNNQYAVCLVPVAKKLDLKSASRALGLKRIEMATSLDAERITGYKLGGISPLGQKKELPMLIDQSVYDTPTVFISAGRRGLEIEIEPQRLSTILAMKWAQIAR